MKKVRSLKQSLTIKFLLLATLPIVIVGVFALQNITSSLEEEIGNKNFLLAKSLSGEIERFLNEPVNLIRQIEVVLFTKKMPPETQINSYLNALSSSYPFFELITVLDPKGRIAYLSPFNRDLLGSDMSSQHYFELEQQGQKNDIQFSPVFISARTGRPTLTISKRINSWMIVGHLDLSALERINNKITIGEKGYAEITDVNGTLLAHKNRKLVRERFNIKGLSIFKRTQTGKEGTFRHKFAGEEKIGSVTTVPMTGWQIHVTQPVEEAFRPVKRIRNIILAGLFLSLVAATIFAIYSIKKTLTPVIKLTTNVEKIAEGRYVFETPSNSYREINNLAEKFNLMARGLAARENSLKESEANYRDLVQSSNSIILRFDSNYQLIFVNKFGLDFFGYSKEELIGRTSLETIIPHVESTGRNLVEMMDNLFNNPDAYVNNENENVRKNGERVWVAWRNQTIYDSDGKFSSLLCTGYDITGRKLAEEGLQSAHNELEKRIEARTLELKIAKEDAEKANKLKSEFLANMSHELRTPMHHILAYSKFGADKTHTVSLEKLFHYFSQIRASGDRLLTLLNDLLDLSKMESGMTKYRLEKIDLATMVEFLISEFSLPINQKSLLIEINKTNLSTIVLGDELKISQVLNNLLANAIKFTPQGQSITISFHTEELPGGKRKTDMKTVPALLVRIKDTGIGVPEKELKTIFNKFIQSSKTKTGAGGTGLGLSICQEIINAHNGIIWAENNLDIGATFSFMLPFDQEIG